MLSAPGLSVLLQKTPTPTAVAMGGAVLPAVLFGKPTFAIKPVRIRTIPMNSSSSQQQQRTPPPLAAPAKVHQQGETATLAADSNRADNATLITVTITVPPPLHSPMEIPAAPHRTSPPSQSPVGAIAAVAVPPPPLPPAPSQPSAAASAPATAQAPAPPAPPPRAAPAPKVIIPSYPPPPYGVPPNSYSQHQQMALYPYQQQHAVGYPPWGAAATAASSGASEAKKAGAATTTTTSDTAATSTSGTAVPTASAKQPPPSHPSSYGYPTAYSYHHYPYGYRPHPTTNYKYHSHLHQQQQQQQQQHQHHTLPSTSHPSHSDAGAAAASASTSTSASAAAAAAASASSGATANKQQGSAITAKATTSTTATSSLSSRPYQPRISSTAPPSAGYYYSTVIKDGQILPYPSSHHHMQLLHHPSQTTTTTTAPPPPPAAAAASHPSHPHLAYHHPSHHPPFHHSTKQPPPPPHSRPTTAANAATIPAARKLAPALAGVVAVAPTAKERRIARLAAQSRVLAGASSAARSARPLSLSSFAARPPSSSTSHPANAINLLDDSSYDPMEEADDDDDDDDEDGMEWEAKILSAAARASAAGSGGDAGTVATYGPRTSPTTIATSAVATTTQSSRATTLPLIPTGAFMDDRIRHKRLREIDALTIVPYKARTIGSVRDNHIKPFRMCADLAASNSDPPTGSATTDAAVARNGYVAGGGNGSTVPPDTNMSDKNDDNGVLVLSVNGRAVKGLAVGRVDDRYKGVVRSYQRAPRAQKAKGPPSCAAPAPPGVLVHDLMLSPSTAVIAATTTTTPATDATKPAPTDKLPESIANTTNLKPPPGTMKNALHSTAGTNTFEEADHNENGHCSSNEAFHGTDVEAHWRVEGRDLQRFLTAIKLCIRQRSPAGAASGAMVSAVAAAAAAGATPVGGSASVATAASGTNGNGPAIDEAMERQARQVLEVLEQDLAAVKKAAEQTELDMRTFLRTVKPHKLSVLSSLSLQPVARETSASPSQVLLCRETWPPTPSKHVKIGSTAAALSSQPPMRILPGSDEYRNAIVSAARDAAIFRETARIIRRKARELCARRIGAASAIEAQASTDASSLPPSLQ